MKWSTVSLLAAMVALTACDKSSNGAPRRAPDEGTTVVIGAADVVSGFAGGVLRRKDHVDAFRISKYPTTVVEYRACVADGVCSAPAVKAGECGESSGPGLLQRATYDLGAPSLPVTCATVAQAKAYCAWRGGALPTPSQWALAARGAQVTRFAWGDVPATCDQHPESLDDPSGAPCAPPTSDAPLALYTVGAHPKSASPSGVEDVLLGRGELLAADVHAQFPACAPPNVGCFMYGARAGAIDSVAPAIPGDRGDDGISIAATFRCAFEESAK